MTTIEELQQRIRELEAANEQLEAVFDSIPGSIYWKDINGVYLGRNQYAADQTYCEKFHPDAEKKLALGKTDYDIFSQETADLFRKNDLEVMSTGKAISLEEFSMLPDGRKKFQISQKRPLRDRKGNIIGVIGNTVDITAQKQLEAVIKEQEMLLEKISFIKALADSFAHELRTPLAAIGFNRDAAQITLDNMLEQAKQNSSVFITLEKLELLQKPMVNIKTALAMAINVVNVTLNNIRTESLHAKSFTKELISLVVADALKKYPLTMNEQNKIHWDMESDFEYFGDRDLTIMVLFNLIANALYFIKEVERGEIFISLQQEEKYNKLIFLDTAKGIAPDLLPHIFERFKSTRRSGSGLGLYFCKRVMQVYGGDIICESKDGEYTKFILSFPKVQPT